MQVNEPASSFSARATASPGQSTKKKRERGVITKSLRSILAPSKCSICTRPASCYYYGVPCCTSCKAFIRRTLTKRLRYACKATGNCSVASGAKCSSCRLDRCLLAGVNFKAVRLPPEDDFRGILSQLDSRRRQLSAGRQSTPTDNSASIFSDDIMDTKLVEHLIYLEAKSRRLRESSFDPQELYWANICEILQGHYHLSDADKYQKPPNWPMSTAELIVKSPSTGVAGICHSPYLHASHLKQMGAEEKRPLGCTHYPTLDLILSIEVAKTMPVFQKLDAADQQALLRHVALVNATLTEAFYSLEHYADTITFPNGFQPMAMRQRRRWSSLDVSPVQPLEYDVFCRLLEPLKRVGLTTEEYVLLKALVYCLDIECLSWNARRILRRASQKYAKIMLHQMQLNLGEVAGAKKYAETLSLVDAFLHFTQKIRHFYLLLFAAEPKREPSSILGWAIRV